MTACLLLLNLPEPVRRQYHDHLTATFPQVEFRTAADVRKADAYLADIEVLVTFGPHLEDRADHVLSGAPRLRWIQALGTGVDNIVDRPALRPDVIITNIHGIHGAAVSEAALAAMLSFARQLPRVWRNQHARKWDRFPARVLDGKTVSIVGVGAIAAALAPRCKAMGMRVIGVSSAPRDLPGFDAMRPLSQLGDAAAEADYLVLLTPYSEATRNLVDALVFAAMKPSAILVNLARGGVADEDALIEALRSQTIAGAALDVFATEPLPDNHPFWSMDNVVVTPHLAGFNVEYAGAALEVVDHNMRAFLAGAPERMINLVRGAS